MPRYYPQQIEQKWQTYWEEHQTFRAEMDSSKEKLYVLDMFPYPSGSGLHVGHPEGYTATDIICRYSRMKGKAVLHPMGWDAFGLPAEQYAIETGTHPRETTEKNIDTFRTQLKMLGFSYDWQRELSTTDTDYFKWTQWIFLVLFDTWYDAEHEWTGPDGVKRKGKGRPIAELPIPTDVQSKGEEAVRRYQDAHRLAYQSEAPVNWCPALGTVLANEEVTAEGLSDRGNHPVERRNLRQWMLRITSYAERLIEELEELDWSESIKLLQRNWIGRSEGAEVDFFIGEGSGTGEDVSERENLQQEFASWKESRSQHGFPTNADEAVLRVYTTRPDTLYGATYMVLAPEHPFVDRLTTDDQREAVNAYQLKASLKSDLDRTDLAKEKTGVFTGACAINPVNGEFIPIWIADYVLISYGTGAIMAVPAHDLRDWEFACQFNIPIIQVVEPPTDYEPTKEEELLATRVNGEMKTPFAGHGMSINSDTYNGLKTAEFKQEITLQLEQKGRGKKAVNYRLRDWLFSRQRYWGEPFPIWHELDEEGNMTGLLRTVPETELPVTLPEMQDFKPKGTPEPPLSFAPDEWLYTTAEDGTRLKRETNSMPQWAGSCWYFMRFCDPANDEQFLSSEAEKYWMPVDLYIGGAEHAVLHLLYSRFWHKVLFDRGYLTTPEPFQKLVNQGMILGEPELTGYRSDGEEWISVRNLEEYKKQNPEAEIESLKLAENEVEQVGEKLVLKSDTNILVEKRAFKMSKSRGNVVNPDDIVNHQGADSLRLYEMFMGPLEQVKPWSMSGVEGVRKFLGRVWRMIINDITEETELHDSIQKCDPTDEQERMLHKTIKAVTEDIEKLSFNTAISRMMEFTNFMTSCESRPHDLIEKFVLLLSPFAPHIAEELWQTLGHDESLAYETWPTWDESKIQESEIEIPVQVNGKLRAKIKVPADANKETMQQTAEQDETVQEQISGKQIVKVIVVPGRMVNFVVK